MIMLWNPSIRKSIAIAVPEPGMSNKMDETVFGFGVCPVTHDPKIIMIQQFAPLHEKPSKINDPREVMLYTLSSGKWTSLSPASSNVLSKSIRVQWYGQVIDRFIYWSGLHLKALNSRLIRWNCNLILSFDMTDHTFQVIDLPDSLAKHPPSKISIFKLRESLVIFQSNEKEKQCHDVVWMMENNGVEKSFTKVFAIIAPEYGSSIRAMGLRNNGTLIMQVKKDYRCEESEIVVYEPKTQHLNALKIDGVRSFSTVNSYKETLVLLGSE
ncbi:F-box protein CPR1-like [Lactuca sativa]|uniref:F-box associated beta-propeller type 3 domain-containing protein n=8 Tax=Lactuca sativa TaxID=4236 RepID=A0A9R1XP20_LACSA|nr:F-box protein CPR1 [Lactuca sativa]XP_052624864.1 F-box protein CPR1-like [Lactuca sativa]XP_052624865.1 F-box protein CPR1-like [Lactuca sativa]XP_052624866.1 F-box protein CPR1-like [Lactuca sativa]XP_052624867.1 F-box protein CPR1-like [Lactuca sativa]XP_052624868.1 F-box protein CPR1-like [Lactuca sativa]XP_052624869.1 F-box protein CPR1-like [Lactuca sativa]XP_052624870.1 F-box protein CPR1-like [Lactuca sativa]KAJ0219670.1 hypothetical protein LSAT_V11C200067170 [Lactuca sativa]KA